MGKLNLNLSTRPFPAYRLTNIALAVLLVALVGASIFQGYSFLRYSSLSASIRQEERNVRSEADALAGQLSELEVRLDRPEAIAKLSEIDYLNSLITRKSFSWTRVFSTIESMIPDGVHLTSLRPAIADDGSVIMEIELRGRSIPDVAEFIEVMESSDAFEDVRVSTEQLNDTQFASDVNVSLTAFYLDPGNNGNNGNNGNSGGNDPGGDR